MLSPQRVTISEGWDTSTTARLFYTEDNYKREGKRKKRPAHYFPIAIAHRCTAQSSPDRLQMNEIESPYRLRRFSPLLMIAIVTASEFAETSALGTYCLVYTATASREQQSANCHVMTLRNVDSTFYPAGKLLATPSSS